MFLFFIEFCAKMHLISKIEDFANWGPNIVTYVLSKYKILISGHISLLYPHLVHLASSVIPALPQKYVMMDSFDSASTTLIVRSLLLLCKWPIVQCIVRRSKVHRDRISTMGLKVGKEIEERYGGYADDNCVCGWYVEQFGVHYDCMT